MTKVSKIKKEGQLSHVIKVETDKGQFTIPVVDVRDGLGARGLVNRMTKSVNRHRGSKFMAPSYSVRGNSYQNSFKP